MFLKKISLSYAFPPHLYYLFHLIMPLNKIFPIGRTPHYSVAFCSQPVTLFQAASETSFLKFTFHLGN